MQKSGSYNALQQDDESLEFLFLNQTGVILMQNFTETMNEQFKQLFDMQTKSLEPMRIFAGFSTDAVEQLARQNYAVAGDMLEYATKSANLPLSGDNIQEVASAQVAEASTFAELMGTRATEYADMAQALSTKARDAAEAATASFK